MSADGQGELVRALAVARRRRRYRLGLALTGLALLAACVGLGVMLLATG